MCQRAVIVARRFKSDNHGPADGRQIIRQAIIIRLRRHHRHAAPAAALRSFKENLLAVLGHIDGYQHGIA